MLVAKGRRRQHAGLARKSRRSSVGARVLTGVEDLPVPVDARAHDDVWEGHLGVGVLEVVAMGSGEVRAHRNRGSPP
jgi:hypothetical protein